MEMLEHPDITEALRTGYPICGSTDPEIDEDAAYQEAEDERRGYNG